MAVRLDIRPRLTLRSEPVAKVRRGPRLPPLTFPALTYWLAMGALTYAFAHIDENPLQAASLSPVADPDTDPKPALEPAPALAPQPEPEHRPEPALEPRPEPQPDLEPEPALAHAPAPAPEPARRANREAGRRGERRSEILSAFEQAEPAPALSLPADPPRLSFPEFSDSSRPRSAERASSGPRIDADLFGGSRSSPRPDAAPDSAPPESDASATSVGSSCEAAIARNNEELTIGAARGAPDITRGAYAAILENGRYLSGCSIPDRTVFEVCAAVQNGRAVGITVVSSPASPKLNACVRRTVSRLKFPQNSRLDVTHTRFDRARR